MKVLIVVALVGAMGVAASEAPAATYASSVVTAAQLGLPIKAARSDLLAALGPADDFFYSLGLGGHLTVSFGQTFSGKTEIKLTEVTWLPPARYGEAVDIFAIFGGVETLVGTLTNAQALSGVGLIHTGIFDSLKFVDVTATLFPSSPSDDGFDIDSIELTTVVPAPLGAGMLLTGLGSFGFFRARRRAKD